MKKYAIACCDNDGRCFGFLDKKRNPVTDEKLINNDEWAKENLLLFNKKSETTEICMQINMSHALLPNGSKYRVTYVATYI